jgi:hypothetical protein
MFLDLSRPEIELARQLLDKVLAYGGVRSRANERRQLETGPTPCSGVRRKIGEQELEEGGRMFEEFTKRFPSALSNEIVRIHTGRQYRHRDLDTGLEQDTGAGRGGAPARRVCVIAQEGETVRPKPALEKSGVVRSQRRAQGGDDVFNSNAVQRETIEITLHNQHPPGIGQAAARAIEAEES